MIVPPRSGPLSPRAPPAYLAREAFLPAGRGAGRLNALAAGAGALAADLPLTLSFAAGSATAFATSGRTDSASDFTDAATVAGASFAIFSVAKEIGATWACG